MDIESKIDLIKDGHMHLIAQLTIGENMEICKRLRTAEQERDQHKEKLTRAQNHIAELKKESDLEHTVFLNTRNDRDDIKKELVQAKGDRDKYLKWLRERNSELDSLRAQLKAAQEEIIRIKTPKDDMYDVYETFYMDAHAWLRPHIESGKLPTSVIESMQEVIEFWAAEQEGRTVDGSPSELEMHRADYDAIKAAGFESPGELLAAYRAAQEQEPAVHIDSDGVPGYAINYDGPRSGVFYAAPIPAQPSPVAVPVGRDVIREVFMRNGFTVKDGQSDLKDYVFNAAYDLLSLSPRIPAQPSPVAENEGLPFIAWSKEKDFFESMQSSPAVAVPDQPKLTVWYGSMPESNGRENWTAILHNADDEGFDIFTDGHTIDRSEYPERVKYAADCVRWLIGELPEKPFILDYDANKRSSYESESSPRITEQDAREIAKSAASLYYMKIDEWYEQYGRALLNKLNNKTKPTIDYPEREELRASDLG